MTDPATESAKAVQEVAKATGKGIDAAREAGGFIAKCVGGPLTEAVGIWTDRLKYVRWEQQVALMTRANQKLAELGLSEPTQVVPLQIAIPIIQEGSMQSEGDLQDRWANLLVNAANASSGIEIKTSFISMLRDMSSLDVRILDAIYRLPMEKTQAVGVWPGKLPALAVTYEEEHSQLGYVGHVSEEVVLSLGNLARLGCLTPSTGWDGAVFFTRVYPTILGKYFVAACTLQPRR